MRWRKVSHARNVCLSLRTRSYVTHICVHVNCQNWPTIGIPEAGMIRCVENNANRFHFRVSLQLPRGFRATFLDPLSHLSWETEAHYNPAHIACLFSVKKSNLNLNPYCSGAPTWTQTRTVIAMSPSLHSIVSLFISPYSSPMLTACNSQTSHLQLIA